MAKFLPAAIIVLSLTLTVHVQTAPSPKVSKHPIVVVISYDGFRYDYLDPVVTPTLSKLKQMGVSAPHMRPVFPTKTFPNHQSIVTGLYAASHGIVDNVVFDKEHGKLLSGFNDDPGFWNFSTNALPIWLVNELEGDGRVSGTYMWPGSDMPYEDGTRENLRPTYSLKYNGSVPWENRVATVISWITNETHPANLVYMYYNEPDSKGHTVGPNDPQITEEVQRTDARTDNLLAQFGLAGLLDKVNFIFTSDHGMAEMSTERQINIGDIVDKTTFTSSGGSPVLQIQPIDGQHEIIYNGLKIASDTMNFSVYNSHNETDKWNYYHSRRVADIVAVADPGYGFINYYRDVKMERHSDHTDQEVRISGVHGYDNHDSTMWPFFIAFGPMFRENQVFEAFDNVDLFPLVCKMIDIKAPANNGSLAVVEKFLRDIPEPEPSFAPPLTIWWSLLILGLGLTRML